MPDIQLRFHRDMLVLSSPVAPVLARQGFTEAGDVEYATLMEPEAVEDALRLNLVAGAQCLVTETAGMTPARLAHHGMADRMPELAKAALDTANTTANRYIAPPSPERRATSNAATAASRSRNPRRAGPVPSRRSSSSLTAASP